VYYIVITHSVYRDKTLNDGAKLLYGLILSLSQKEGYCWADNDYLAETLNKSKRMINYHLQSLKEKGYIFVKLTKNSLRQIVTQDTRVGLVKSEKPLRTQKERVRRQIEPDWLQGYIDEIAEMRPVNSV